jgi:hypothetical protein
VTGSKEEGHIEGKRVQEEEVVDQKPSREELDYVPVDQEAQLTGTTAFM